MVKLTAVIEGLPLCSRWVCVRWSLHSISLTDFIQPKVLSVWFSSSDRSAMGRVSVSCMNRHITVVTVRIQVVSKSRWARFSGTCLQNATGQRRDEWNGVGHARLEVRGGDVFS